MRAASDVHGPWQFAGFGLRTVHHCLRCGARRFCDMGERMPYQCVATPEWLRLQRDADETKEVNVVAPL